MGRRNTSQCEYMNPLIKQQLTRYRNYAAELESYRASEFPLGTVVLIDKAIALKYGGYGIAVPWQDLPPDLIRVRLQNGNEWHYPLESAAVAAEPELWPLWIRREKGLEPKLKPVPLETEPEERNCGGDFGDTQYGDGY